MSADTPSVFLPPLHPRPSASVLPSLSRLSTSLQPLNTLIDLRHPLPSLASGSVPVEEAVKAALVEEEEDEFERNYARGWLERVVSVGARALARGEEGWEDAVDQASGLLAFLSGPSAQGSSSKTYLLPSPASSSSLAFPTPPATRPPSPSPSPPLADLTLTIRETTLLQNSTGHRTWGSAPLLAQRIAASPTAFFPTLSSPSPPRAPLRVLELGSGTGLVGLSAAAVVARHFRTSCTSAGSSTALVTLTDGGSEPLAVLDNLSSNAAFNASALEGVEVRVEELDWREFLPPAQGGKGKEVASEEKYDVVLAADVAYEPGMAEALHAAVSGLLRFPSMPSAGSASSPSPPSGSAPLSADATQPAFHLIIPLRPTHIAESATISRLFPPPFSPPSPALVKLDPLTSRSYRLVAHAVEELDGPDGFGGGGGRAKRGRAEGEMRYRVLRVGWEEVSHGAAVEVVA